MNEHNVIVVEELIPALIEDDLVKFLKIMENDSILDAVYYGGNSDIAGFKDTIYERWVPNATTLPTLLVTFGAIKIFKHLKQNSLLGELSSGAVHDFNPMTESLVVENSEFFATLWKDFRDSHQLTPLSKINVLVEMIKKSITHYTGGELRIKPVLDPINFAGYEDIFKGLNYLLIDAFNHRALECFQFLLQMGVDPYKESKYGHIPYLYIKERVPADAHNKFLALISPARETKAKKMGKLVI